MLPDADYLPTACSQPTEVALIARTIRAKFLSPRLRQLSFPDWQPPTVPKITVDEHCNTFLREDDVGTTGKR